MSSQYRYTPTKPVEPHVITAEVLRSERVTPNMQRVTLGGEGLTRFTPQGYDQWFRLFLPRPGQEALQLPTRTSAFGWYAQYLRTPKPLRPWIRNYTVRAWRPAGDAANASAWPELEIDFAVHLDEGAEAGPAISFALGARPGDAVGLLDQGLGYEPGRPEDWQLLVADETGLPAIAGIVAAFGPDARAEVFIEIPEPADAQPLEAPAGVRLHWLARSQAQAVGLLGADAIPGALALEAVRAAELPTGSGYAYLVGESALATGLRRHLVNERGLPKQAISFVGYWRHGVAASS